MVHRHDVDDVKQWYGDIDMKSAGSFSDLVAQFPVDVLTLT